MAQSPMQIGIGQGTDAFDLTVEAEGFTIRKPLAPRKSATALPAEKADRAP